MSHQDELTQAFSDEDGIEEMAELVADFTQQAMNQLFPSDAETPSNEQEESDGDSSSDSEESTPDSEVTPAQKRACRGCDRIGCTGTGPEAIALVQRIVYHKS